VICDLLNEHHEGRKIMKRLFLAAMLVLLMWSWGCLFAADYIRVGVDSIAAGTQNAQIPFFITRQCPTPAKVLGTSNGFELNATGSASWEFVDCVADQEALAWFSFGMPMTLTDFSGFPGETQAQFLIGGAAFIPYGMPIVYEHLFFTLTLNIGDDDGEILIDSAFFPPGGNWKFSGMNCGQGGDTNRPLFLAKDFSNANHPIHITIYADEKPEITNCPDTIDANHCNVAHYQFEADPGSYPGAMITGWSVIAGQWSIGANGFFQTSELPCDTYWVKIEATNNRSFKDTCEFYVVAETEHYTESKGRFRVPYQPFRYGPPEAESLTVEIITDGSDAGLEAKGIKLDPVKVEPGYGYFTAQVSVEQYEELKELRDQGGALKYVIPSERQKIKLWEINSIEEPVLDTSTAYMFADSARIRTGLTGAGVIIGVIDQDFDAINLDFAWGPNDHKTLFFWDQQCSTGCYPPPQGFAYGSEFTKDRFDNFQYQDVDTDENTFHGTLVASVAAVTGGLVQPRFQFRLNQYTPQHDALISPFSPEP
jgi:hypothetical protein